MIPIKIVRYEVGEVAVGSGVKYNVNNMWKHGINQRPSDYEEKRKRCLTGNWISLFHDDIDTITIDEKDLKWIKEAFDIGGISGRFPQSYKEELDHTCKKREYQFPSKKDYFVRTEYVSLKHGIHSTGPYNNIKSVIESIITSKHNHSCFEPQDTTCKLYLMKWIPDYDEEREFRVFVYNNAITALSSQNIYKINDWLNSLLDRHIVDLINSLLVFFEEEIKNKLQHITNYTIDIYFKHSDINKEKQWYFIEPNGFGANYAAGSALYHWIDDHDLLHGNLDHIEFRYTSYRQK